MKARHNKKRNTAFLFEALVRELTKSVIKQNTERSEKIKHILGEHFRRGMVLFSELDCYNALSGKSNLDQYTAEKMVFRAKKAHEELDSDEIFTEQSAVISKINKSLGKEVYNTFVPHYQSLASLSQIFGNKTSIKNRVLVEQKVVEQLTSNEEEDSPLEPVDSLVVKSFIERFNSSYGEMLTEQKEFLGRYVTAFGDAEADFRLYVGQELKRIYDRITESLNLQEVAQDTEMVASTKKVLEDMSSFNVSRLRSDDLLKILKLQKLVSEYESDGN